jgi:hypothetical protein
LVTVKPSPVAVTTTLAGVEEMAAFAVAVSVNVDEPASLVRVTGDVGFQEEETFAGNPETLKVTAPLYVALPVRVNASVTVPPCLTVRTVDAGVNVREGEGSTCKEIVLDTVSPSPVAVTVTLIGAEVTAALAAAVNFKVDDPVPLVRVIGDAGVHEAETLAGRLVTFNVTAPLYALFPARPMASVMDAPCTTFKDAEAGVMVSTGAVCTFKVKVCDAVSPSPVAVTVTVAVAAAAVDEAAKVSVSLFDVVPEVVAIGLLDHCAVTPLGKVEVLREMFPVKDPPVVTVRPTVPVVP